MRTPYSCLLAGLFILCFQSIYAQTILDSHKENKNRFYVGADVGLKLGTSFKSGSISPFVGYKITEQFSMGIESPMSIGHHRLHDFKFSSFGVNAFARLKLKYNFFLYTKLGLYRTKITANQPGAVVLPDGDVNVLKEAWDVGIGYRTKGKWGIEAKLNYQPFAQTDRLSLRLGISHKF